MATSPEELDSFHRFALTRLESGASLDELLMEWSDGRDRESINSAIRRGLDDVQSGRFRSAAESSDAIRLEYGIDAS